MPLDVAILLSIGRHPASGRSRRADLDARALELALRLGPEARLHGIHAGDPAEPALADYLGMGLASLTVLRQPPGADILPALVSHLGALKPALVLAGLAAETGEGSGMLPYLLAEKLGATLLPAIAEAALAGEGIAVLQALPRGRRRKLAAGLPAVITVDRAAPAGRQSAFAKARAGRIVTIEAPAAPRTEGDLREVQARPKPKRLKIATGGSAAERLRAATEMQSGRGQLLVQPAPEVAAAAIFDYLVKEGILSAPGLAAPGASD
jgi:N,N-dimethylglycine/sarcosine catabolism electron transfer flavoprotein subunit beta